MLRIAGQSASFACEAESDREAVSTSCSDAGSGAGRGSEARIGSLTGELDTERQVSQRALSQVELLNQQIAALRQQIARRKWRSMRLKSATSNRTPRSPISASA
jgi:chemotaxis protein MotB